MTFFLSLALNLCLAQPTFDEEGGQKIQQPLKNAFSNCIVECQGSDASPSLPLLKHLALNLLSGEKACLKELPLPKHQALVYGQNCDKHDILSLAVQAPAQRYKITFPMTDLRDASILTMEGGWAFIDSVLLNELCTPFFAPLLNRCVVANDDPNFNDPGAIEWQVRKIAKPGSVALITYGDHHASSIRQKIVDISNSQCVEQDFHRKGLLSTFGLQPFTQLTSLKITICRLSDISHLKFLQNLVTLELFVNKITDISALGFLTKLQNLNIEYNQVNDVKALANLTNLKSLIMSYNKIKDLSPLVSCQEITNLDVSDNVIDPKTVPVFQKLAGFTFSNNSIYNFSDLKVNSALACLDCKDNPGNDLPFLDQCNISLKYLTLSRDQAMNNIARLRACTSLKYVGVKPLDQAALDLLKETLPHSCGVSEID